MSDSITATKAKSDAYSETKLCVLSGLWSMSVKGSFLKWPHMVCGQGMVCPCL